MNYNHIYYYTRQFIYIYHHADDDFSPMLKTVRFPNYLTTSHYVIDVIGSNVFNVLKVYVELFTSKFNQCLYKLRQNHLSIRQCGVTDVIFKKIDVKL